MMQVFLVNNVVLGGWFARYALISGAQEKIDQNDLLTLQPSPSPNLLWFKLIDQMQNPSNITPRQLLDVTNGKCIRI
jgi:hypothetical protein